MNKSENSSANQAAQPHQRIKQLIVRVGDQGISVFKRDLEKLSDEIIEKYQKETETELKELIIKYFVDSIGLLSQKGALYATAVTLIDLKITNFAELIIDRVLENLQKALDNGDLIVPKHSLIFLGELMNIGLVNSFSFITLLYDLVNEAEKTLKQSFDYYLYIVISIFPYLIDGLSEKSGLEFKSLIENIQEIMKKRDKTYLNAIRHYNNREFEDKLSLWWNTILEAINKKETNFKTILKPYLEFEEVFKNIKQIKKNKKIYFNNKNAKECIFQSPEKISFLEEEKETISLIDKLILSEDLSDIINLFQKNKKTLIQKLLHYQCPFNYEWLLAELILSELINLPNSKCKVIFYSSVILTLANDSDENFKNEFKNHLFLIVDSLFRKLENLDYEIVKRIKLFLSFYLSNTNLKWDFKKWELIKEEENSTERENFLKSLFNEISFLMNRKTLEEEITMFPQFLPKEKLYKLKFNEETKKKLCRL